MKIFSAIYSLSRSEKKIQGQKLLKMLKGLTWVDEGNIVITTSLDSATSKGVFFAGIPLSANFPIASWFLEQTIIHSYFFFIKVQAFYEFKKKKKEQQISQHLNEKRLKILHIMHSHCVSSLNQIIHHSGPHIPQAYESNILPK